MDVDHSGLKSFNSKLFDAIPHGFFTRIGGYSKGIYKGLNCGRGSADKASNVEANRQAVTNYFGKNYLLESKKQIFQQIQIQLH